MGQLGGPGGRGIAFGPNHVKYINALITPTRKKQNTNANSMIKLKTS
jgi:hypothetical protein